MDLPSLLIILIVVFSLIYLANTVQAGASPRLQRFFNWLMLLVNLPIFLLGLALLFMSPQQLSQTEVGASFTALRPAGIILLLAAIWGLLVTLPEVRRLVARIIPIDPTAPVHALALVLAGYLVANSIMTLTQGGLELLAQTRSAASIFEVLASGLLYGALGLAGVGFLVRRRGWKLLDRLGLQWPTARQLLQSVRWVAILLLLQWIAAAIMLFTNPQQAEILDEVNTLLLEDMDTPVDWFLLSISAAVGEELLFRGALQPVFGLWATSLLFAISHIQYGFTVATVLVFVIGLLLGIVRRRHGTSIAIAVHFLYNFVLGLLTLLAPYLERLANAA